MPLDFTSLIHSRYSCRNFSDRAVSDTDLRRILYAGLAAPTACNFQPFSFFVVRGKNMSLISGLRNWFNCSTVVFLCCNHACGWKRSDGVNFADTDLGITCAHMLLQAEALNINSCTVASFDTEAVRESLQLKEGSKPYLALCFGYCSETDRPSQKHNLRRTLEDICTFVGE